MNKKLITALITIIIVGISLSLYLWILPSKYEEECKKRVFEDMESNKNEVIKSVVGIIPENTTNETLTRNGTGSGVIFEKQNNTYYVVTAYHVINFKNTKLKIFTIDTEFKGETIKVDENVTFELPDESYYESMLDGKVEYVSKKNDLAILSFEYDKELPVLEFETNKISKNDKVMVIGHPEGKKYQVTYGYIKSNIKTIKKTKEQVIEHNAYMTFGNSGGVALSKNMKIIGINIGGYFNRLGYFDRSFMIPSSLVEEDISTWKNSK